jgi:hypothetical protein
MKYSVWWLVVVLGGMLGGSIYGQQPLLIQDNQVRVCAEHTVELVWADIGIVGRAWRYWVRTSISLNEVISVNHEIWKEDEFLISYPTSLFDLQMDTAWTYRVKSLITTNNWCVYVSQFPLSLYDRSIVVIGEPLDEITLLSEATDPIATSIVQLSDEKLSTQQWKDSIATATTIIIEAEALPVYLDVIGDTAWVERLYVISDLDLATYRKLLATHSSLISFSEIIVIERDAVWSFFTNLLLRPEEETQITKRQVFEPGLSQTSTWSILWSVIEKWLSDGVSLQIIRFFLLIPLIALVMTILRQVVGLTTYSIRYPLIIAWTWLMIGRVEVWLLMVAGALSVLVVAWLTKKIYLLSWAKTALIGALYALLCILWYFVVQQYNQVDLQMIDQSMVLYTIMILYVCMSIFRSPSQMIKRKRWVGIIEFTFVTFVVLYLLESAFIFDQLLAYPDIIWIIIILIIVVWRFTGLQLTEYARFMPLIGYLLSEEEE